MSIPTCDKCNRPLLHPIRGIQKFNPNQVFGECTGFITGCDSCGASRVSGMLPLCNPPAKGYIIWVGEAYYDTPDTFLNEAIEMGISRKIRAVPKDLKIGDYVYVGFRKAVPTDETGRDGLRIFAPGVFSVFPVRRIEKLLTEEQQQDQTYISRLVEKGITPVVEYIETEEGPSD